MVFAATLAAVFSARVNFVLGSGNIFGGWKKENKYVLGSPGIAFDTFIIGGLVFPYNWLAIIGLVGLGFTLLLVHWLVGKIRKK